MRVAVKFPHYMFGKQLRNFNGYNYEFVCSYADVIYWPLSLADQLSLGVFNKHIRRLRRFIKSLSDNRKIEIVTSLDELKRHADVLLCFNGEPYKLDNVPDKSFNGLKIAHVMDYVFYPRQSCENLLSSGVDAVMGYCLHDQYCEFFKTYYPDYIGRTISVPFGFGERFNLSVNFEERMHQVLGIGSVNPVDDPAVEDRESLIEYIEMYSGCVWTHLWRRKLSVASSDLKNELVSYFPTFPKTKDPNYDPVERHQAFSMFANDEGLMNFPPARTYEGAATGAVMVAADNPIYRDLGFKHGHNALFHRPLDIADFKRVVNEAQSDLSYLKSLSEGSKALMDSGFSHKKIAEKLYTKIKTMYQKGVDA